MKVSPEQLSDAILNASKYIRYVAIYRDGDLLMRERGELSNASSSESDKYEELIVNPTLLKLVTQRGEIDCGGVSFVLIRYGNFWQCVIPAASGHISVGMEANCDPLAMHEQVRAVIDGCDI
jgi:hypothetical protein